jgi:hypothetical protein
VQKRDDRRRDNTIISAKTVEVTGTPTSINIDTTGQIFVTSVPTPDAARRRRRQSLSSTA